MSVRRWTFDTRGSVADGVGAVAAVESLIARRRAERVLVLANRSVTAAGLTAMIEGRVGDRRAATYAAIRANAPRDDVAAAAAAGRAARCDAIVAIGGSSVTDAAKMTRLELLGDEPDRESLPLALVPTTLSSGELTAAAGTTGVIEGEKSYVIDPRMAPTLVVLDPEVTLATPRDLWLSSGVKAIDHACEALWAARPHPYSDALAADALRRLLRSLPRCASDPNDLDARLDAQLGGWFSMAGMTRHGPGPSHLLGHQLAARCGVGHGITSCVTLPHVLRFVGSTGHPGAAAVGNALGASDAEGAAAALTAFVQRLGLPTRLSEVGVDPGVFDEIAVAAHRHGTVAGVAVPGGVAALHDLLAAMW